MSVHINVEGRQIPRDDLISLQNLYGLAPNAMNNFLKKGEKATTTYVNLKLIGERRNRLNQRQRKLTLKEIRDAKKHAKINGTGGVNVMDDLVNTNALYGDNNIDDDTDGTRNLTTEDVNGIMSSDDGGDVDINKDSTSMDTSLTSPLVPTSPQQAVSADKNDDPSSSSSSSSSPSSSSPSSSTPTRRLSDIFNRVTSHIKGEAEKLDARITKTVKEECKKAEIHHKKWSNILKSGNDDDMKNTRLKINTYYNGLK